MNNHFLLYQKDFFDEHELFIPESPEEFDVPLQSISEIVSSSDSLEEKSSESSLHAALECPICNHKSLSVLFVKRHMKRKHLGKYRLLKATYMENRRNERNGEEKSSRRRCVSCQIRREKYEFVSIRSSDRDVNGYELRHICGYCATQDENKNILARMYSHKPAPFYHCENCAFLHTSQVIYIKHCWRRHCARSAQCTFCTAKFGSLNSLAKHINRIHTAT